MASLPPRALHCLAALKRDLLSRRFTAEDAEGAEAHGQSEKTANAELAAGPSVGRIDAPGNTPASAFSATSAVQEEPRRAEVESQQRMRPAKRSKASIASRYYQRRDWWTPVY